MMNDKDRVSDKIDELLAKINPDKNKPKKEPKPRAIVWSNGLSTTHIPPGFKFRTVFKDDMNNIEKTK